METLRREIVKVSSKEAISKLEDKKKDIVDATAKRLEAHDFSEEAAADLGNRIFEDVRKIISDS